MWHLSEIKRRNSAKARPGDKLGSANGNPNACRHMQAMAKGRMGNIIPTRTPMASVDEAPMPEYMTEHGAKP